MAPVLIIGAFVVVLPFLTYYVTSLLFFRQSKSKATQKRPPTIPYFIPGLFNALGFAQSGARKYFAELIRVYGTFAPFQVRAGLRSYIVLRDPVHIKRVLDAPENLTSDAAAIDALDKLFGSPAAADQFRWGPAHTGRDSEAEENEDSKFRIPDSSLAAATDAYISIISANLHDKMFQFDSWTRIEDFWSFLQLVLLRCTLNALFGSSLLKDYPRLVRDYLTFDEAVEGYMYSTPSIMMRSAGSSRDRLHRGIRSWIKSTWEDLRKTDLFTESRSTKIDPVFDEATGLSFIRKHYDNCYHLMDKFQSLKYQAMAADVLGMIHATHTELVSSTFWTTIETLRKSHLTRNMTASIEQRFSLINHQFDIIGLSQEPLIKSIQTEVRRLRTATCTVRTNKLEGFPLDKQWSLAKDTTVLMFSYDISLNADLWKKMQPRALEKPLEEFWAERFMLPAQKSRLRSSTSIGSSNAVLGDVGDLVEKLATSDQYPGFRLVSTLQLATLAVLFTEFEIQLCDIDEVDAALPPLREFAFGTVKPIEKVAVRIRKRRS